MMPRRPLTSLTIARHAALLLAAGAITLLGAAAWSSSASAQGKSKAAAQEAAPQVNVYQEFNKANRFVSLGGLTRAIPHYEIVLRTEPLAYSIAHYNLAEVYRAKKQCDKAVFHYQAYILIGNDDEAIKLSRQAIRDCSKADWPTLAIRSNVDSAKLTINGFMLTQNGTLDAITLAPGSYEIELGADEWIAQTQTIQLTTNQKEQASFELEKKTFHGTAKLRVDKPGAQIRITARKLDKSTLQQGALTLTSPINDPIKLPTGQYEVEVTLNDHERWLRYITVRRDQETTVDVTLTRSLPAEIRID